MEPSPMRTTLRLTPIPDSAPQKSLIIKLPLSNTKNLLKDLDSPLQTSNNLGSDYLPGEQIGEQISKHSTRKAKKCPKPVRGIAQKPSTLPQTNVFSPSATPTYQTEFPSSPASSVSTVPAEPEDSSYIACNALRVDAARDIVSIFYSWGRYDINTELYEAITIQNAPADEAELLQKRVWVRGCLRSRYKVWIQSCQVYSMEEHRIRRPSTKKDSELGMECEYPGCGKVWERGECRVSFEPREWTEPANVVEQTMGDEEEGSTTKQGSEEDDDYEPAIPLPNYQKLMTPQNICKYGRGEFYCLRCFEKLLETTDPAPALALSQKKRKRVLPAADKYPRPSPMCRIYASVLAETRVHAEGKFLLDGAAAEVVRRWKDKLFEKGIKRIMEQFGGFFKEGGESGVKIEEEDGELNVGEGRGLAELLVGVREANGGRVGPGRKRRKY